MNKQLKYTFFSHICPSRHVVGMQWKEQTGYGIVDLSMECALVSEITGQFTFTFNASLSLTTLHFHFQRFTFTFNASLSLSTLHFH